MIYVKKEKLEKCNLNKENMYVIMDFDGTITKHTKVDSWDVAGDSLGENFKKELVNLYDIYRPIETNYNISNEEKKKKMEEWYTKCIYLYYKYNLKKSDLENSVANCNMLFRDGVKEFLNNMDENNVPVIILSAGIGNVIEEFLKNNNCYYKNIYIISNFLEFDYDGNMKEFDGKIIYTMNKKLDISTLKKFNKKLQGRCNKLLFGDLIEDKNMIDKSEWDTTISVGFLENNIKNLDFYKEAFDIVLTEEDTNYNEIEKIINI
mgnify:CR=1 FL=1